MRRVGLLVLGSFINSLGTGLTAFGLAIVMLRTYGTASSVSAVQMSSFAPIVLLAPLAGILADRYDRRLMMIIGDAGSVLGLGIILIAPSIAGLGLRRCRRLLMPGRPHRTRTEGQRHGPGDRGGLCPCLRAPPAGLGGQVPVGPRRSRVPHAHHQREGARPARRQYLYRHCALHDHRTPGPGRGGTAAYRRPAR